MSSMFLIIYILKGGTFMKLTLFFVFMFAVLLFLALVMVAFFGAIIALPIILIKSNKEKKDEAVALQINPSAAETTASGSMEGTVRDQQIDSTL